MTDQPRDLAAEVEEISRLHDTESPMVDGWRWHERLGTVLDAYAALSRELGEHRKALRWALDEFIVATSDGMFTDGEYNKCVAPPAHLAPILAEAMRSKP